MRVGQSAEKGWSSIPREKGDMFERKEGGGEVRRFNMPVLLFLGERKGSQRGNLSGWGEKDYWGVEYKSAI